MIEVRDLHKSFGAIAAVAGVTFTAQDGQITGLLGPNGAGKTTTLRMLYTLMQPDRGSIRVDGIDAARDPMGVRRRLGALPDARGLYKRLTARENIDYFARLQGLDAAQARARCDALLGALDMTSLADRRTEGFSQGERVKTALARALVHDPRNVVLDEPTNGLDVMATRSLRAVLRGLRAEGRCVLMSTTSCRRWPCCAIASSSSPRAASWPTALPRRCASRRNRPTSKTPSSRSSGPHPRPVWHERRRAPAPGRGRGRVHQGMPREPARLGACCSMRWCSARCSRRCCSWC